jgi:hypothetical protein
VSGDDCLLHRLRGASLYHHHARRPLGGHWCIALGWGLLVAGRRRIALLRGVARLLWGVARLLWGVTRLLWGVPLLRWFIRWRSGHSRFFPF